MAGTVQLLTAGDFLFRAGCSSLFSRREPFEGHTKLKQMAEMRRDWWPAIRSRERISHFEGTWTPERWPACRFGRQQPAAFLPFRQKKMIQFEGTLPPEFFEPIEDENQSKVITIRVRNDPREK